VVDVTHPIIGVDFLPISVSWWTAETADWWMESRRYPYRPKPPARWSPAFKTVTGGTPIVSILA
jgi:hypothetical protein